MVGVPDGCWGPCTDSPSCWQSWPWWVVGVGVLGGTQWCCRNVWLDTLLGPEETPLVGVFSGHLGSGRLTLAWCGWWWSWVLGVVVC